MDLGELVKLSIPGDYIKALSLKSIIRGNPPPFELFNHALTLAFASNFSFGTLRLYCQGLMLFRAFVIKFSSSFSHVNPGLSYLGT
jgi:hypothetical protein